MKLRLSVTCAVLAVAVWGGTRSLTGLESVLQAGDPTNGGFWNVSGRTALSVQDSDEGVPSAFDATALGRDFASFSSIDLRAFTFGLSTGIPIRTDPVRGLLMIVR